MASSVAWVFFSSVVVYVMSWATAAKSTGAFRVSLGSLLAPVVALSIALTTSLALASSLPPVFGLSLAYNAAMDGMPSRSLDAVEVGVLAALVLGSVPFFAIAQTRPGSVTAGVGVAVGVTLVAGLAFISTESVWLMFLSFEFLLLSSVYILLLTSKSERARDAALEMLI